MYYFLYSSADLRHRGPYSRGKKPTKFNKFDLDWLYAGIRRRYKIYDSNNTHELMPLLREANVIENLPRYFFILEIADPMDAMWAKLNAENLTKNNERYGMQYHGSVGPITPTTLLEIQELKEKFSVRSNELREIIRHCQTADRHITSNWIIDCERSLNTTVHLMDSSEIIPLQNSLMNVKKNMIQASDELKKISKVLNEQSMKADREIHNNRDELNRLIKEKLCA